MVGGCCFLVSRGRGPGEGSYDRDGRDLLFSGRTVFRSCLGDAGWGGF